MILSRASLSDRKIFLNPLYNFNSFIGGDPDPSDAIHRYQFIRSSLYNGDLNPELYINAFNSKQLEKIIFLLNRNNLLKPALEKLKSLMRKENFLYHNHQIKNIDKIKKKLKILDI